MTNRGSAHETEKINSNALGRYIRNRRKELNIPGGSSGLARELHRSVGYLSRVERGIADGPSLKFLQDLSHVLKVDVKHLLKLKEEDNVLEQTRQNGSTNTEEKPSEAYAGSLARRAAEVLTAARPQQTLPEGLLNIERLSPLRADLKTLAVMHENIAKKLLPEGYVSEALAELHKALAIYEFIGDKSGVAFSCFNIARIYRQMPFASPDERLQVHFDAAAWFERAYVLFSERLEDLSDEHLGRRTECLAQLARVHELIAQQLARSYHEAGDNFGTAELLADLRRSTLALYFGRARAMREEALVQYGKWIERLQANGGKETRNDGSDMWEHSQNLLGDAFHRTGVLCRDLARSQDDLTRRNHYLAECVSAFRKALIVRRELAGAFPNDIARTENYLDRLANTHGEFGTSIQLQQNDNGMDGSRLREEAYWQFRVAAKHYEILGFGPDDPRVVFVVDHMVAMQSEEGLESDIISRQRVDGMITHLSFGTKERPEFDYPLVYCMDDAEMKDSVLETDAIS